MRKEVRKMQNEKPHSGSGVMIILIVIVILSSLSVIIFSSNSHPLSDIIDYFSNNFSNMYDYVKYNFFTSKEQKQFTQCQCNCKNIGTALEMYSTDHQGHYPTGNIVAALVPTYLKSIPTCPSAGADTYSSAYSSTMNPDEYTFYCNGLNHNKLGVQANYPQYYSTQGIGVK
jgi:hypothetical protein